MTISLTVVLLASYSPSVYTIYTGIIYESINTPIKHWHYLCILSNMTRFKQVKINENLIYVTSPRFTFSLEDDKSRQFGVLFEIIDMFDETGDKEFKQYPFVVSIGIIADKCHKSFNEAGDKPDKLSLIQDCNQSVGNVPVGHILDHKVKPAGTEGDAFSLVSARFNINEATVIAETQNFGTIAAQYGLGAYLEHLRFKDEEAAQKYIDYIVNNRLSALSTMIGLILDRPINLIGDSGWSVITRMVKGKL